MLLNHNMQISKYQKESFCRQRLGKQVKSQLDYIVTNNDADITTHIVRRETSDHNVVVSEI